jgi:hypothetical protein
MGRQRASPGAVLTGPASECHARVVKCTGILGAVCLWRPAREKSANALWARRVRSQIRALFRKNRGALPDKLECWTVTFSANGAVKYRYMLKVEHGYPADVGCGVGLARRICPRGEKQKASQVL